MSAVEGSPAITPNSSGTLSLSVVSPALEPHTASTNLSGASTPKDSTHSFRVPGAPPSSSSSSRSQRRNGHVQNPGCLLCRKSSAADSSCNEFDNAYREVFFRAMEIVPECELQEFAQIGIPFCQTCRDKVVMMFAIYNNVRDMQTKFEAVRNDLAFTTVECNIAEGDATPGPMNDLRTRIVDKWIGVYEEHAERHKPS